MQLTKRKSYTDINKIYFFTATIHKWYPLLADDDNKKLMIAYLKKLSSEGLLTIYAFVLMPNHIHIIWKQNKLNGKETPQSSFLKYTAHEFLKTLKTNNQSYLYEVNAGNKKHEIWQRDSLSIEIYPLSNLKCNRGVNNFFLKERNRITIPFLRQKLFVTYVPRPRVAYETSNIRTKVCH